ncbi:hypothetical protein FKM82_020525 [Ascaphus truei]
MQQQMLKINALYLIWTHMLYTEHVEGGSRKYSLQVKNIVALSIQVMFVTRYWLVLFFLFLQGTNTFHSAVQRSCKKSHITTQHTLPS